LFRAVARGLGFVGSLGMLHTLTESATSVPGSESLLMLLLLLVGLEALTFLLLGLYFIGNAIWYLVCREEWHVAPDRLEIRWRWLGFGQGTCRRFENAQLVLDYTQP